jgi:TP901 family phage tail tape measure protein
MLDAGSVITTLRFKADTAQAQAYDAAVKKSIASGAEAEAATNRLSKAHASAAASAGKAAAANDALGASGKRLGGNLPLQAMGLWDKNNKQAADNLGKLGTVAAKTAAVGVVVLAAATVYAATKAVTFNQQMLKIQTQAGGSASEVKTLSREILAMGGTVPQGPQKLAESLYHVESAGFRGAQALEMTKAAAMGAALGQADLQNTTQAMIATMASQIKGVKGSADAMGQLNAIVGVGDMRMEQLAQAMATGLLPSAANAGLSLKDVGAALATVTDNATPANVTATRLRMTIALMASPSKAAAKQLESIGMSSTQMAHDMRQPNGLLKAVEDLKTHLKDSGLTAEQQFGVLSKVFGGGRSSAVIQTLIAETDRLKTKYQELGKTDGVKRLTESWAAFQKSEAGAFGELKSGAEAFAITVGNVLMPTLTKVSHEGAHMLDGFIQSGGAEKAGHGILSVFETLAEVAGHLGPPLLEVAHALVSVGSALGLGNATELAAIAAAFLTFKSVTFVAPILGAIAGAIGTVATAAMTAPTLAAFGADLFAMIGPVGLVAGVLAIAAGAFIAFGGSFGGSTSAAQQNAAAMRADKEAIEDLHNATAKASEAHLAAERATLAHKKAVERLKQVEQETKTGKLKGSAAGDANLEARIGVAETANQRTAAIKTETDALEKRTTVAAKSVATAQTVQKAAQKELQTALEVQALHPAATRQEQILQAERIAELQENYNRAAQKTAQITAEVAVKQESLNRLNVGQSAITAANAQGVQQLQNALSASHAPQKIVTRYELEDQGAQAKLGELSAKLSALGQQQVVARVLTTAPSAAAAVLAFRAILAGVPSSKVIGILHNAPSAQSAMNSLNSAIKAVPAQKGVNISTNAGAAKSEIQGVGSALEGLPGVKNIAIAITKTTTAVENIVRGAIKPGHASGRGTGPAEVSLVGEGARPEYVVNAATGKGTLVNSPTLMGLGASDYVVPLEDQFRGRALGLFAMLAKDLGVPGYKGGKKGKGHPGKSWAVPNAIPPLSLPLSDIESKESAAKSSYDQAATKVHGLEGQVHTAERTLQYASPKGNAKAKAASKLAELHKQLAAAQHSHGYTVEHRKWQEWTRTLREAKKFDVEIKERQLEANNAGNAMKLAAGRDDLAGYNAAKGSRLTALGQLQALIKKAEKQVKTGTEYALQLQGNVQSAELEQQGTTGESFTAPKTKAEEEEERTGMTGAEIAEDKRIEKNIALAALTPDLADDKARAGELVSFLERVLGEAQSNPARGGDEVVKSLADQVKSARSNLASLSGSGTNENADLQAQINQKNQQVEVAQRGQQIAEQTLQVFGGSGDIGSGGRNAAQAGANITINTLHPGDPATLNAIGAAATAGIGLQGLRESPRVKVGP